MEPDPGSGLHVRILIPLLRKYYARLALSQLLLLGYRREGVDDLRSDGDVLVLPLNIVGPGPAANALRHVAFADLGVATEFDLVSLPLRLDMYIRTDRAISILVFTAFLGRVVRVRSSRVGGTVAILARPRLRDPTVMQARKMVRRDALREGCGSVQWPIIRLPLLQLLNH